MLGLVVVAMVVVGRGFEVGVEMSVDDLLALNEPIIIMVERCLRRKKLLAKMDEVRMPESIKKEARERYRQAQTALRVALDCKGDPLEHFAFLMIVKQAMDLDELGPGEK